MWKDFFYFSKADRRAMLFFIAVILATTLLRFFFAGHHKAAADSEILVAADTIVWTREEIGVRRSDVSKSDTVHVSQSRTVNRESKPVNRENPDTLTRRPLYPRRDKYPYGTVIDLNVADTVSLKHIPGIGSYYARRIVEYRERLGGYVDVLQLAEIEGLPDSVRNWFLVTDTFPIRRISVNDASLSELRRHPYMDFYKARDIVEYRKRNGKIKNPVQLSLMEGFSGQDLERLEPYLGFD